MFARIGQGQSHGYGGFPLFSAIKLQRLCAQQGGIRHATVRTLFQDKYKNRETML